MTLKKRIIGFLLASSMLLSMMPVAFAVNSSQVDAVIHVNASAYTDHLDNATAEKYYKFTIDSDGYVSLDFGKEYDSHTARGWGVTVYTPFEESIVTENFYCGNTATENTCQIGLSAGTYYIKVCVYNGPEFWTDVNYHLKVHFTPSNEWETEINDTVEQADAISAGSTYYGSLRESDDIDYYKFTIESNGSVSLNFGKENCNASKAWDVVLLNSGKEQIMSESFYGGNTATENTCHVGLGAGTYYIGICAHDSTVSWTDVTYNFNVGFTASTEWETEFNNESADANEISTGNTYYGSLHDATDTDYFSFTLDSSGSVYLNFGSEMDSNPASGWNINLYDSDMQLQQSSQHQCATTETEVFPSITLEEGTYYIGITLYNSWSSVPYNFTVIKKFTDVSADAYYANAVDWGVENHITSGATATTFAPNAACTRAQIVTMLWRAMGSPEPSSEKNPFTDVKSDKYFYKPVLWAVEKGITSGTTPSTFSPDATCTRAQAMTFLWNCMGQPSTLNAISFKDVKTNDYYYKAVRWAVKMDITKGTSETAFSPNNQCTRAQIITFLYKAMA